MTVMALFERSAANPILAPDPTREWESQAVFNPGVVEYNGTIYMLYRAVGEYTHYVSRLGLATSHDGVTFERSPYPCLVPSIPEDRWGLEDPRVTMIDGRVYITYTAISQPVRETEDVMREHPLLAQVNLVSTEDFSYFQHEGLITPDYSDNKDTVLFPQQFNGCYVMLHRPHRWSQEWCQNASPDETANIPEYIEELPARPSIWISYSKDLKSWFDHQLLFEPAENEEKIGAGPPPVWTERGWLLLYHTVHPSEKGERIYSAKAALLDKSAPTVVKARTAEPILSPRMEYECAGDVPNVVFPSGAFLRGDTVFMYYGAADSYCALATGALSDLWELLT